MARRRRLIGDRYAAARKLLELVAGIPPVDGRIHIEKINEPFLSKTGCMATGTEFAAGLHRAVEQGWFELHESCTLVKLLPAGDGLLRPN